MQAESKDANTVHVVKSSDLSSMLEGPGDSAASVTKYLNKMDTTHAYIVTTFIIATLRLTVLVSASV